MTTFHDPDELPRFAELEAEYEILRELGRGGTAVVYLARERELGRQVAIKVIRAAYVEDEEAAARLSREAHMVGGLQHPNIVVLYGTRRLRDRSLALIMQFVPGRTLKAEIETHGALPFDRCEQILSDVGRALAYAHRQRIVHRDIKPENVYVDDETGIARLSDFGIARPWDADSGLTMPGTAIGTPAYMSPEQIDGGSLDGRSDIYSLGVVGYEMLTGVRPWSGESLFGIIYKQKHEKLPPLDELRPGIPPALQRAVEGALQKDPADRWPDADRFLAALSGRPVALPSRRRRRAEPPVNRPADPIADAVTLQYRRPEITAPPSAAAAPTTGAPPTGAPPTGAPPTGAPPSAAPPPALPGPQVATAEPPTPELEVPPAPVRSPRWQRHRGVLAAAGLLTVLVGTAITIAIAPWTDRPGPPVSPAGAATAPSLEVPPGPPVVAAAPPGPAVVYALLGAQQEGTTGDTLSQPLVVQVEDAQGRAVAGAAVQFRVVAGQGTVEPAVARTDSAGMATSRWVVQSPGAHRVEASVDRVESSAAFTAMAFAAGPARLVNVSGTRVTGEAGAALPGRLVVRAVDARGQPVAGAAVQFAVAGGGGSIEPATALTSADGTAQARWVLGPSGTQEATAALAGVPNSAVLFSAGNVGPAPLPVRTGLAAGGTHTCTLGGDGALSCWGGNDRGQVGDGTTGRRETPVRIATPEPVAGVAAGVSHTCAVTTAGSAWCWGSNAGGQLGDGSTTARARPVRVAAEERLTNVAVGTSHSCALGASGALYCWGENTYGQLGDGTRAGRTTPVRAAGERRFRSVALGWSHTCAIGTDGVTLCWGRNAAGQVGDGGTADRADPVPVTGGYRFTSLAAGSAHTCGIRGDGTLLCWGQNSNGQLGTGAGTGSPVPTPVQAEELFSAVAAGGVHTCALNRDGAAFCWGRNIYGQLGDGTTEDRARPTAVAGGLRFTALAANGAHSCGSVSGSGWYCWGYNVEGQLGDGTRANQVRPAPVWRR